MPRSGTSSTAGLSGPVNLTGPAPVTNSDFAATLGRVVHRPALLPVPGFALRIALGEFAGDVVIGQRAIPSKLLDSGFTFAHATLTTRARRTALTTARRRTARAATALRANCTELPELH